MDGLEFAIHGAGYPLPGGYDGLRHSVKLSVEVLYRSIQGLCRFHIGSPRMRHMIDRGEAVQVTQNVDDFLVVAQKSETSVLK
jgi:hypothetical protein